VGTLIAMHYLFMFYLFIVYFSHLLGLQVRLPPEHGRLSVVSVVCCQLEVSPSG
jgi:hypothetical protein